MDEHLHDLPSLGSGSDVGLLYRVVVQVELELAQELRLLQAAAADLGLVGCEGCVFPVVVRLLPVGGRRLLSPWMKHTRLLRQATPKPPQCNTR